MSFETIKDNIQGYIETRKELKNSKNLIDKSEGLVSMRVYNNSSSNLQGRQFGPMGYYENEMDAIRREIKKGDRVVVSGEKGIVTILNRNNKSN
ncbi:MAG: hypothetical protein PHE32_01230 [Candidatus Shapirobacteria bacterium]|nr:hypothetical protein [Candidatus Shapirobacteria bacterium]MDD4410311.1 hypothetical protein [Candidatus Shapirobacteria bacterium]